jgi:hypothetical protein
MKKKLLESEDFRGNLGKGILGVFLALLILGPILGFGWIISGFFGGLIARGSFRGFMAGLLGGIILGLVMIEVAYYISPSVIDNIISYTGKLFLIKQIDVQYLSTRGNLGSNPFRTILNVVVEGGVVTAIGGFIGGSILQRD